MIDELTLYEEILELTSPWFVEGIELDKANNAVEVYVVAEELLALCCPLCDQLCPRYDKRKRRWRHLDSCQYRTYVTTDVPRVQCQEHGIHSVSVPWAEERSRFTLLFEARVIGWLLQTSISAVARELSLSWNAVDGIMKRAVARGLIRREQQPVAHIGVDETSFKKGHDYVTVVTSQQGKVLDVEDGKGKESLRRYYKTLSKDERQSIKSISMDMSPAYVQVTLEEIPGARRKISFDKFHVAKDLNKAVDDVRKMERRDFTKKQLARVKGKRFLWLYKHSALDVEQQQALSAMKSIAKKTSKAWAVKELAMSLWDYRSRYWAKKAWHSWYDWAMESGLQPIEIMAESIKNNLWGIINAIVLNRDNGNAESVNSKIKILKIKARGYRNKERFKTAILFHYGGLNLYPELSCPP